MPGFVHLFRCVGKAAVKNGGKALANLIPLGEVAYEIARDANDDYRKDCDEAQLRAELEQLALAPQAEVRQAVEEVVAGQPAEVRQALTAYLTQLPASIHQSLRRPSDPSGTTVPVGLSLKRPEDLLPFLPAGLPRFKPGDRPLAADWELVEMLGKGGFGEVWKARHVHQSRKKPVALKFCLDPVAAATLRNEAALHDHLDRVREEASAPGIVPLLETYLSADPPCLMYEFIEGGDLAGFVQEMNAQNRLTPEVATRIVHRLASIVAVAHRLSPPIVHRDLKMSNALVRRGEGDLPELFIADFGIGGLAAGQALREQAGRQTLPTAVKGAYTPLYASPQQVAGGPPDPRDDVHALGVLWYQMVAGNLGMLAVPPDWRDVAEERGLGEEEVRLLGSCIASRADKRVADAGELSDRVGAILGGLSVGQRAIRAEHPSDVGNGDSVALATSGTAAAAAPGATWEAGLQVEAAGEDLTGEMDDEPGDGSESSSGLVIASTLIGGCLGAAAGWYFRGLVGAFLGGLGGWLAGCGAGLLLTHLKKRRRAKAAKLIAKGSKLRAVKRDAEALDLFRRAGELDPDSAEVPLRIAFILLRSDDASLRNPPQALEYARRGAGMMGGRKGRALRLLADVFKALGRHGEARAELERAMEGNPNSATTLNHLAWLYATCPDPAVRDGARAVRLAAAACEKTRWLECHMIDTLAAAHAEAGQFDEAVRWQLKALELASEAKRGDYESRVRLYRLGQPFRVYSMEEKD